VQRGRKETGDGCVEINGNVLNWNNCGTIMNAYVANRFTFQLPRTVCQRNAAVFENNISNYSFSRPFIDPVHSYPSVILV